MLFICFSATSWETLWQVIYVERNRPNGECSTLSLARAIEKCLAPYATHSSRASQIIHIISASADHFIASNIIRINMVRTKLKCFSVEFYAFSLSSSRMQMYVLGPAARHIQMCSAPKWPRHRTKPLMWTMRAMPAMTCIQNPNSFSHVSHVIIIFDTPFRAQLIMANTHISNCKRKQQPIE